MSRMEEDKDEKVESCGWIGGMVMMTFFRLSKRVSLFNSSLLAL